MSHDYNDNHRLKMSRPSDRPKVACTKCHPACDGRNNCLSLISDHHSRARDADTVLFQLEFFMTMSVTFCKTGHSKKSNDKVTTPFMFLCILHDDGTYVKMLDLPSRSLLQRERSYQRLLYANAILRVGINVLHTIARVPSLCLRVWQLR